MLQSCLQKSGKATHTTAVLEILTYSPIWNGKHAAGRVDPFLKTHARWAVNSERVLPREREGAGERGGGGEDNLMKSQIDSFPRNDVNHTALSTLYSECALEIID